MLNLPILISETVSRYWQTRSEQKRKQEQGGESLSCPCGFLSINDGVSIPQTDQW